MSFAITHRNGAMEADPSGAWETALLRELASDDTEHPDVAVQHESGWSLSASASGFVIWENVADENGSFRQGRLSEPELLAAWRDLAAGQVQAVDARIASLR